MALTVPRGTAECHDPYYRVVSQRKKMVDEMMNNRLCLFVKIFIDWMWLCGVYGFKCQSTFIIPAAVNQCDLSHVPNEIQDKFRKAVRNMLINFMC